MVNRSIRREELLVSEPFAGHITVPSYLNQKKLLRILSVVESLHGKGIGKSLLMSLCCNDKFSSRVGRAS